ncbi:MAG: hypothetical protein HZA94_00735 [Candidatus Vogelbacteria bacterium]|nr:hypothetical protein [Candidatus Vogelbacteria bacterium]
MKNLIHSFKVKDFHKIFFRAIINIGLSVPTFTFAFTAPPGFSTFGSVGEIVTAVLSVLPTIAIPIAGIYIVYAGYLFVSSTGEPKQLDAAKSAFYNAVIGTALIVGASIIVSTVSETVSGLGS